MLGQEISKPRSSCTVRGTSKVCGPSRPVPSRTSRRSELVDGERQSSSARPVARGRVGLAGGRALAGHARCVTSGRAWRCRVDTGRVLPGGDPSGRADVVQESERTRVTRLFLPGRTVVRKEPRGPDAQRRLQHELAILERLRGVSGVAQLVAQPRYPGAIVLGDAGAASLAGLALPLAVDDLVGLGLGLARAVAGVHGRGVVHRDISPANIVISADGSPCLVDFALATSFAEIRPEFIHHCEIVGTLAYLAPEQTGRTGRSVDQRADLYGLGATLYELATGAPPFGSDDPLQLIHDHLARVPTPPAQLNPAVPTSLSKIIMHLLEKEPDHRYQTAAGLVYDLERVRAGAAGLRIGERDVPLRLLPPSRLVGREEEVAALQVAFEDARAGRCRGVLVGGAPGVGKTALIDELRPVVTGRDGWFVAGKFDQYRRDLAFDAVYQAFRALGRLLLAEPEDELAAVRERILGVLGTNAGLVTATSPEFAALLGTPPDAGDPLTAQVRTQRAAVAVLRAVASRERPVVVFVDDLQWAGHTPLGVVDLVLTEEPIEGLLLVSAYRDADVDTTHPLQPMLSRWQRHAGPDQVRQVRLENLPVPGSAVMVAEMLRVAPDAAAGLVEVIEAYTQGNPYETVELLNALRGDGVLAATIDGWRWNAATVRARLRRSEVAGLLAARVAALPARSRRTVEAMACLGGRAELSVLQTATAGPADGMGRLLAPALDEGLLVLEPGANEAVRFRHDRTREAILAGLDPQRQGTLQLAMARRLARVSELFAVAAEQYLPVIDAIDDPAEQDRVVGLLRRVADQAALIGDYALMNALLVGALRLVDPGDAATVVEVRTARHAALFSLGRLDEADEEYRAIAALCPTAVERADATAVQVHSLTHRTRFAEAIDLGLESLRECGITVPAADRLADGLDHQFGYLYRWLDHTNAADDPARPDLTEPTLLAATCLIDAVLPTAYFLADPPLIAWLGLEALRIWTEHGPTPTLLGPACHAAYAAGSQHGDYAAGYRAMRRILARAEARGHEPATSQARHMFAALSWLFEPIEHGVHVAQRAREGLIAGGDMAYAGYTYVLTVPALLDCAPTLENFVAEVEAAVAFFRRTGSEQTGQWLDSHHWLARVLRGDSPAAAGDPIPLDRYADNPLALLYAHLSHALAAAIFDEPVGLTRHTAAAMPLLSAAPDLYPTAVARLLYGLALAEHARATDGRERGDPLPELDEMIWWLASRATDAPDNFRHLLRLLEAERAWAVGDFRAAVLGFDAARREVADHQRPWHRALITERAARFHLAHGIEHTGRDLLTQARQHYLAWGAAAKVAQLDWVYPVLQPPARPTAGQDAGTEHPGDLPRRRATVTTGTLDLLGILSASQALSSETSIDQLHPRVVTVLGAMTGATGVRLLLWSDDRQDWLLPTPHGGTALVTDRERDELPMSVLRYAQRMREPLVVADATRDDRFALDPYFTALDCCSVLALPVLSRSTLRAVLLLENRLIHGAFTADRLDGVKLIAGQLAVSLDNAQLYAELTSSRARIVAAADQARRRIERDLHDGAQQRLVSLALQLQAARAAVPPEAGELAAQLHELTVELTGALDELRDLARGIHPAILAEGGLRPALRGLARRAAIPVELDTRFDRRLPEQIEIATYYLVAETLTNAAKHAHASAVRIEVETVGADDANEVLRVRVHDDGRGGADPAGGSGLVGLKDRIEALGGRIRVQSPPGAGTTVQAELPLNTCST
ncbi:AAA family ATPase [Pseudonocardia halophobica]|uniref:AAA family ATPase n=1 Tax=Pseudonocardia halophobica TaxID=29401 RepID=UPI003D8D8ED7